MTRPLYEIAEEITADYASKGKPVYFAAAPYVEALSTMTTIEDSFYDQSGRTIVAYLISNLSYWRGDVAKRVKAELKAL